MMPKVESVEVTDGPDHGRYYVEPLETGFGHTVGNALRRVLLSSLPGAAITSIKIDNIYHEFSAIPDLKEDTTELILNIKQIRLRSFSDSPVLCQIEAQGPGQITAADIICPPEVEIVNPEHYLASLDGPDSRLNIELTVERGRGYAPAEHKENQAIAVIPVDAIYTPIRKVNYQVIPTRVGQVTNRERLVLDVWTDGSIAPDEAVSQASDILIRHFRLLKDLGQKQVEGTAKPATSMSIPAKVYDTPIEDLELTVRAYNCLKRAGITKVGQVLEMTEDDLLGVRNFGQKSLDELQEKLSSRGLLESSRLSASSTASLENGADLLDESEDESEDDESDDHNPAVYDSYEPIGGPAAEPVVGDAPDEDTEETLDFAAEDDDDDESLKRRRHRGKETRQ